MSPLATLARGYSVTSASDGKVLKQTKQVKTGDLLTTRLNDGWVESEVRTITPVKKTRAKKSNTGYSTAAHSTRFSKSARARSGKIIHCATRF